MIDNYNSCKSNLQSLVDESTNSVLMNDFMLNKWDEETIVYNPSP
jgi:hypothetical protein